MLTTRFVVWMFSVGMMMLGEAVASGQTYPNKTIRIVASEAGGTADFNARIIAQGLTARISGQSVVVENRAAIIAAETAAKATPDGYTTVVVNLRVFAKRHGDHLERISESESHSMGLQIPHCVYTETAQEGDFRIATAPFRRTVSGIGKAQGSGGGRRASNAGPRAHVRKYSTKDSGVKCGGLHEREECDCDRAQVSGASAQFHWRGILARGYFVSTVGLDEETVRAYIQHQETEDERYDQMKLKV